MKNLDVLAQPISILHVVSAKFISCFGNIQRIGLPLGQIHKADNGVIPTVSSVIKINNPYNYIAVIVNGYSSFGDNS